MPSTEVGPAEQPPRGAHRRPAPATGGAAQAAGPPAPHAGLQRQAGNAATARAVAAEGVVLQRQPADFGASPVLTLKSGWGFLALGKTPWDHLQAAVRDYAALRNDQLAARHAALRALPGLIRAWEVHHQIGVKPQLDADETAKVAALATFRQLIARELRELAAGGLGVDEAGQGIRAVRFQGDFLLEETIQGRVALGPGDQGLHVTKVQQALVDLRHLTPDKVTGSFDADTATGLRAFQQAAGRPQTGRLDAATMLRLDTRFVGYSVERGIATAPAVPVKAAAGEYAHGAAPAELTATTRNLAPADAAAARRAASTAQVAAIGGALPTFVNDVGKGPYRARVKAAVLAQADAEYQQLAAGKAAKRGPADLYGWAQIDAVALRAKAATDAVFGKYAIGPPLSHGVGLHDAWDAKAVALAVPGADDAAAVWRVNKILTGGEDMKAIDREHGAIQSRGPEKAIIDAVRAEVVAARRDRLIETHKAWPAYSGGGQVYLQRFKAATPKANRHAMWDLFQTVVHEYLHTLEHSRHKTSRGKLGQQEGDFTLREGVTEYFTHIVLSSVTYDDALRTAVEGPYHEAGVVHPIPAYAGYGERRNAEKMAGVVGTANVMAAFFLGEVEKVGQAP